jgi:hypothetical protein
MRKGLMGMAAVIGFAAVGFVATKASAAYTGSYTYVPPAMTGNMTFESTTAPVPSSSSIQEPAPTTSSSQTGGTPAVTASGTPTAPVRNFSKAIGKGGNFGNSWFGGSYSGSVSFFGGRTATLVPVIQCREPYLTGNEELDAEQVAEFEECLDRLMNAASRVQAACDASGLGGIEFCMTNSAFRQANYSDVSVLSLQTEDRILETKATLKADAKVVGFNVSLIDIGLGARASATDAPGSGIHFFIRNFDSYDNSAGQGTQTHDKVTTKLLYENSKTFLVGGVVPVTLEAEIWGEAGIQTSATAFPNSTAVGLTPHARLWTVGRATVDVGLYRGGVQAELTLLEVEVPATASLARYAQTTHDKYTTTMNLDVVLKTLAGNVKLFGKPVWRSYYDYKTLIAWNGFEQTFNLYHSTSDFFVMKPL